MISKVPVVLAFTPNYFVPACVTITSILQGSGSVSFHFISLLSEPLPEYMKEKLIRIGGHRATYSFINLEGQLQDIYIDEQYTVAASYRLLLPRLLSEYAKVLYIDCDIIVNNNLSELYRLDLQGNYLAGVFEVPLDFQIPYMEELGCNPEEYMNSGFLLMDLQKMREDGLVEQFMKASKVDYLQFPDQDVLNQVCQGRILGLPPYNNSIRTFFLPQYRERFLAMYSPKDLLDVNRKGNIHYTGTKPWEAFTIRFVDWWRVYWTLPKEIKQEWKMNKKLHYMAMLLNTRAGSKALRSIQAIYRKIKYSS
ncbi:glycosyltransferase family 8 protein [Sphingobacterium corticibacterium]|uniref:Glycosyltransferase family 8 protein n=1 Tax=Sphingobacterium corticibacterium TaxID=2484746 RepID=A0A4Q6XND7_9SPHI|nr:glycosyltransferase family 8 protein [Sphingobacterium corticibacterium]RZF61680.1 glycosyltransferase family 8 protein [Sphingobacterium corticibacterium]